MRQGAEAESQRQVNWWVRLGSVREACLVALNGTELGALVELECEGDAAAAVNGVVDHGDVAVVPAVHAVHAAHVELKSRLGGRGKEKDWVRG